jgi:hypothetical protein
MHTNTREVHPSELDPHSGVYAASALPMEFPQTSAHNVRNGIHKYKNLAALKIAA